MITLPLIPFEISFDHIKIYQPNQLIKGLFVVNLMAVTTDAGFGVASLFTHGQKTDWQLQSQTVRAGGIGSVKLLKQREY